MTDREFIQREIAAWKRSSHRLMQIKGHLYYDGEHDILGRKRTVIGGKGELTEVENLPNNRIVDNQYGKLVNQKANYLLGQPFVIESDNKQYAELLKEIFNKRFMYSDIDLDANDVETELQAAFEEILWFVNAHLANTGQGDFDGEEVTVIFNRDILISETEAIANCSASVGILSDETIIGMHPWVDDPQKELERLKKQKEEQENEFEQRGYDPFEKQPQNIGGGESKNEE